MITRREFLTASTAALTIASRPLSVDGAVDARPALDREIGITMSSVARMTPPAGGKNPTILEWPRILRDELDMRVIDLNSGVITSHEPDYLDQVRAAADKAGCFLTNMKINRSDIDIGHSDGDVHRAAINECKRWIDTAELLGLRHARPLPVKQRPEMELYVSAYRELTDYAAERGVQMLIENYGWLDSDPEAAARLIEAVGGNVAACPDTGNWSDKETRYAGLASMFPLAKSCDFKAGKLGPDGEHPPWDLERCFAIGWDAGFRGPWCLEHANTDRKTLFRELGILRDMLRRWMAARA